MRDRNAPNGCGCVAGHRLRHEYTGGGGPRVGRNLTPINSTISGNWIEATNSGEADAAAVSCGHGDDHLSTIDGVGADGDGGPFKAIERYCVDHDKTLTIRRSTISRNPSATVRLAPRIPRPAAR